MINKALIGDYERLLERPVQLALEPDYAAIERRVLAHMQDTRMRCPANLRSGSPAGRIVKTPTFIARHYGLRSK